MDTTTCVVKVGIDEGGPDSDEADDPEGPADVGGAEVFEDEDEPDVIGGDEDVEDGCEELLEDWPTSDVVVV